MGFCVQSLPLYLTSPGPKIPQKTPNMSSQYTTKQPQEKPIEVKVKHRSNHLWLCCLFIIGISRT